MAGVEVKVISHVDEVHTKMMTDIEKAMQRVGLVVEAQAKKNVTQTTGHPRVQTGQLRSSITHVVTNEGGNITAEIGTNTKHGKYLEFGHIQHAGQFVPALGKRLVAENVPPYPWLFPAVEMKRDEIIRILKGQEFSTE